MPANKGKDFYKLTDDTLKTVGPILFVTAAGGVLGKVIASSDMVNFIKANAEIFEQHRHLLPVPAGRHPQIRAGLLYRRHHHHGGHSGSVLADGSLPSALGLDLSVRRPALTVIAIGAGAMTVSHANDSYFWVVTNFGEHEGRRTATRPRRCAPC